MFRIKKCQISETNSNIYFTKLLFRYSQRLAHLWVTHTESQLFSSLNYFLLKTFQVWVRTTHPDVLSLVKNQNLYLEASVRGKGINTHTTNQKKKKSVTYALIF